MSEPQIIDLSTVLVSLGTLMLNPGDTLVVMSPDRLSYEAMDHIKAVIGERLPNNPVLVLESGLTLAKLVNE